MKVKQWIVSIMVTLVLSSCVKDPSIPTGQTFPSNAWVMVSTYPIMFDITQTSAQGGGSIDVFGNTIVTERGICWSIGHNPTIEGSHAASGSGKGFFYCNIIGLSAGTTYYYRAYAINSKGTTYGEEESFTTIEADGEFKITISADPSEGGIVYGGGNYHKNQTCTLAAIANDNYIFVDWKDVGGSMVSINANYSFTVNGNRNLVAEFMAKPQSYTISVSANPIDGGIVAGSGLFQEGQSRTVYATSNSDYTFTNWTENGIQVSLNDSYSFIVNGNRNLVANFTSNSF